MRPKKPIDASRIPPRSDRGGRPRSAAVQKVVDRIEALESDTVLPIECDDVLAATSLRQNLKRLGYSCVRRGFVVYAAWGENPSLRVLRGE